MISRTCHGFLDTAGRPRMHGARLRRAARLPGRARAARRGTIRLPHARPFMAGMAHATPDPDAPRQVEPGRSRPARPRPSAEQARAPGAAAIGGWLRRRVMSRSCAGVERAAHAGDLGRIVDETGAAPTTYLPEIYGRAGYAAGGAPGRPRRALRADARAPAGDRRLRREAAGGAAGGCGFRQVPRPPRPP